MSAEEEIERLKNSIVNNILVECNSSITSMKKLNLKRIPFSGPFSGLFEFGALITLNKKLGFPKTLKVINDGVIQNDWTFNLSFTVDIDQETGKLKFYEDRKPIWVYEVMSNCHTLSKKLEINTLKLNFEEDDLENIAKILALTDLCNIISENTEFPTTSFRNNLNCGDNSHYDSSDDDSDDSDDEDEDSSDDDSDDEDEDSSDDDSDDEDEDSSDDDSDDSDDDEESSDDDSDDSDDDEESSDDDSDDYDFSDIANFNLKTNDEKAECLFLKFLEKKSSYQMHQLEKLFNYSDNSVWPNWLRFVGLNRFIKKKNPEKISRPTRYTNINMEWTIYTNQTIFPGPIGKWICYAISCSDKLEIVEIESLTKTLAPEDHFRVYAFIKILNYFKNLHKIR
jgi:hypothetical protein